jgi:hypothetical protein
MPRGGRRSTSFKPGVSGNPGGRPKKPQSWERRRIVADVKALAQECAPEAISTLKTIMLSTKMPPAARLGAATALLDRGYGKPGQGIDLTLGWNLGRLSDAELDQLEALMTIMTEPEAVEQALPAPIEG